MLIVAKVSERGMNNLQEASSAAVSMRKRERKADVDTCDARIEAALSSLGAASTAAIAEATGYSSIVVGGRLYYLHKAGKVKKAGTAGQRNAALWAAPSDADRRQFACTGSFTSSAATMPLSRSARVIRLTNTRHNARGLTPYGPSTSGLSTLEYVTCNGQ